MSGNLPIDFVFTVERANTQLFCSWPLLHLAKKKQLLIVDSELFFPTKMFWMDELFTKAVDVILISSKCIQDMSH